MIAPGTNESATRALTGAVFVVVVMGAVAWSAWSNALLWGVVAALAWSEWLKAPDQPCNVMAQTVARTVSCPRIVSLDMVGSDRAIRPLAHPLLFVDDLGQRHRRLRGGQAFWQAKTLAFSFAREVLGRNPWRSGRFCMRGLGCARFGVDLARRVDGAAVHGRGFDPKRVEAPAKHEGLGKFAAGTRRNHGQV